jgi:hypothetical protein
MRKLMDRFLRTDEELFQALASETQFGPINIQRLAGWGYNRAARKIEEWRISGKAKPIEDQPYRYVLCIEPSDVSLIVASSSDPVFNAENQ